MRDISSNIHLHSLAKVIIIEYNFTYILITIKFLLVLSQSFIYNVMYDFKSYSFHRTTQQGDINVSPIRCNITRNLNERWTRDIYSDTGIIFWRTGYVPDTM